MGNLVFFPFNGYCYLTLILAIYFDPLGQHLLSAVFEQVLELVDFLLNLRMDSLAIGIYFPNQILPFFKYIAMLVIGVDVGNVLLYLLEVE